MSYLLFLFAFLFVAWKVYEHFYYKSQKFLQIKEEAKEYTVNCNALNDHIEELKSTYSDVKKITCGEADLVDNSRYNYQRKHQVNSKKSEFVHECTSTVCKNAERQPFKYLCKYFNIKADEGTLEGFENVLNNFSAAEDGKLLLKDKLEKIKLSMKNDIPFLIRVLGMDNFMRKLGFKEIDFSTVYFPVYTFKYISAGGNKSTQCNIKLDIKNLDQFVEYLASLVKFKKSAAGQRALMTSKLREKIKIRDNHTCQNCGLSIVDEENLLLEIDHIIPVSKGGLSTEENLQTLCWKCNRSKGAKLI